MPFKSKAQARYMFAKKPKLAKEFADKTPSMKALPNKAKKKKKGFHLGNFKKAIKSHFKI